MARQCRLLFRRYVVRFGLPVGALIGMAPLIYGVTWSVEWEFLIARLAIWLLICGGVAFHLDGYSTSHSGATNEISDPPNTINHRIVTPNPSPS